MAKPANFPARKDARRRRALGRLEAYGANGKLNTAQVRELADRIALRLVSTARSIRTKKTRGSRLSRAA